MISDPDKFLIKILNNIALDINECLEYAKKSDISEYEDIVQDYSDSLESLKEVLSEINGIDDLAELDEETIGFVFECLENYETCVVISPAGSKNFDKDMHFHEDLEELLGMFFDDDESEDSE